MLQGLVAVIVREGRVLLIESARAVRHAGHWTPPGGHIEPGETQSEAVRREVAEELGVDGTPLEKPWECPTDDGRYTLHWWTIALQHSSCGPEPSEVSAVKWVTVPE